MADNAIREAIAAALDYPFADEGFRAVDRVEEAVRSADSEDEAQEQCDVDSLVPYTVDRVNLWLALNANGAAEAEGIASPGTDALELIAQDLAVLISRAVSAGWEAKA